VIVHLDRKRETVMHKIFCFIAICAVVILLPPGTTLADHDMTCHPGGGSGLSFGIRTFILRKDPVSPGGELNLIVADVGGATSTSCSSAGGETLPVVLPPDSISAVEHIPGTGESDRYWYFEPVSQPFLDDHVGLSAELPNFTTPDGTPLLTQYRETELAFALSLARAFTPGEVFSVSSGVIAGWQGAMLLEMPSSFTLDELLAAEPSRFPAYTGVAQVADIARIEVAQFVPEPGTAVLFCIGALGIAARRR
jgi:hypothetical protein